MNFQWGILFNKEILNKWLAEKCLQISISNLPTKNFLFSFEIDDLISRCNKDWLIIVKVGCYLDDSYAILKELEKTQQVVIGHILNYPNEYAFYHDSFIAIHMNSYKAIGKPPFGVKTTTSCRFTPYIPSKKCFHDNYTPYSLKIQSDEQDQTQGVPRNGSLVISQILKRYKYINNINSELRKAKLYLYPHHGNQELLAFCWSKNKLLNNLHSNHFRFFTTYYRENHNQSTFWPLNTEEIPSLKIKYNTLIVPSSGFIAENLMINKKTQDLEEVVFYDINPLQLKFKKKILETPSLTDCYSKYIKNFAYENNIQIKDRFLSEIYLYKTLRGGKINSLFLKNFYTKVKKITFLKFDILKDSFDFRKYPPLFYYI